MTTKAVLFRSICGSLALSCVTCAPYTPPVPTNPLGDRNIVRVDVVPASESNPNGPLQMALRKHIKSGWITLGDLCQAAPDSAAPSCPANRATFTTYVTPGKYKVRAEYIGPTGRTLWGSVIDTLEAGFVYTCEVADTDVEGCQRKPIAEATAADLAPPVLAPTPAAPSSPAPTGDSAPGSAPTTSAVCQKDLDCPGDLICKTGSCVSPTAAAVAPPAVEIVPVAPTVIITPPKPSACDACPEKCAVHKQACNTGTVSSCFELGACLCECKLDAGGCGDSMAALTECIAKNRAKANPKSAGE